MSVETRLNAVVLAGGRIGGSLAEIAQTDTKAAILFGGRTLLTILLDALAESGRMETIAVVAPENLRHFLPSAAANLRIVAVEDTGSAIGNLLAGIERLGVAESETPLLVAASDLPFVTGESVRDLIRQAEALLEWDILLPLTSRSRYEAVFPMPRVWTKIKDYPCTGASVLLVRPTALKANRALLDSVFAARKSQIQMAKLLGLGSVLRFVSGNLRIADAERRASQLTGCRCRALLECSPHLVVDIDSAEEYRDSMAFRESGQNAL